jgi:hypothetical protein
MKKTVFILLSLLSVSAVADEFTDAIAGLSRHVEAAQAIIKSRDCQKLDELYEHVEALLSDRENYAPEFGQRPEFQALEKSIFQLSDDEIVLRATCQHR